MKVNEILIVEDEAITARSLQNFVEKFNYSVCRIVATGEEAVQSARECHPDVILMDIRLNGDMDGITAASIINRELGIPIVFTTAHSDESTMQKAKTTNHYGYLIKPIDRSELKSALSLALYRHGMEKKLLYTEEKYRDLVESISDIVFSIDENGVITYISPQVERILGFQPVEVVGNPFSEFLDKENLHIVSQTVYSSSTTEHDTIEFVIRHKDGRAMWFKGSGKPVFINKRFNGVKGILNEISDRKKALLELETKKHELEYANNALKREKSLLAHIMEISPAAILVMNSEGVYTFANLRTEELAGISRTDIIGKKIDPTLLNLRTFDGEKFPFDDFPSTVVMKSAMPVYDVQLIIVNPDGEEVAVSANASPIFNDNCDIEAVVVAFQDISQLKRIERDLTLSLREKEILLKEIHHRIKNNIQIISSLISLQSQQFVEKRDKELLEQVQGRIRSISVLYEKLYTSDIMTSINLKEYVEDLLADITDMYRDRYTIVFKIEVVNIIIKIKPAITLGIIINELITNAVKHAFKEKEECRIDVSCKMPDDHIALVIHDHGRGLPNGFDENQQGTMGMQLVKNLVHQLDGDILFTSEHGTRVEIGFPVTDHLAGK